MQRFRDDKLNDLLTGISAAIEPQQRLQLTGDAQRYLIDNAYVIPDFRRAAGVRRRAVGQRRQLRGRRSSVVLRRVAGQALRGRL
ncbi:hypothetical protein LNP24_10520 [Klebsiella pneumoniae subsp. pneumoniae]|nr:hypothetical protein [Klebsiella pneumoniae subsp. pneumoniae]